MSFMKGSFLALALVVVILTASTAEALPVELALVIDGSGSISGANFAAQKTAYINALNAVIPGFYGDIAIGVWQFSSSVQLEQSVLVLNDATDLGTLTTAIGAMSQLNGATAIGSGITTAATDLLGNGIASDRQVIDVSTDGNNNTGQAPGPAATTAVANGIEQVNALGIGVVPTFNAGVGSFSINVSGFGQEFEDALRNKLIREITGIPEPGTMALLGLGLLGLGGYAVRRRRRS